MSAHNYPWHNPPDLAHETIDEELAKADNEQAAGVGVPTYQKFALPFGQVNRGQPTNLKFYNLQDKLPAIEKLVHDHGYKYYLAGGQYGKPDLANKNYQTGHLQIWNPDEASGGDFGERNYTLGWRLMHELAHALTLPEVNKIYGEGGRIGKLGHHRTTNEALRAVHWEDLAAHKQRELSQQIGVHLSDDDFNRERNTILHDAAHRAVTGQFTEPGQEGFVPHARHVPLHTALQMVRDESHQLGLKGLHDTLPKRPNQLVKGEPKVEPILTPAPKDAYEFKPIAPAVRIAMATSPIMNWNKKKLVKAWPKAQIPSKEEMLTAMQRSPILKRKK